MKLDMTKIAEIRERQQKLNEDLATIQQAAMEEIANRLKDVSVSVDEIRAIADAAGITELDLDGVYDKVDSLRDDFAAWESSNC